MWYNRLKIGKDDVGSTVEPRLSRRHHCFEPTSSWPISHYLRNIIIYLFCAAQRLLRTIFMQKSKPKYACLPRKIVEVWIERFCVRYDWWRRLQLTSSVSPVCVCSLLIPCSESQVECHLVWVYGVETWPKCVLAILFHMLLLFITYDNRQVHRMGVLWLYWGYRPPFWDICCEYRFPYCELDR